MNVFHALGFSGQQYFCPIRPRPGEKPRFWHDSPAHVEVFAHARDIIVPDPRSNTLPVFAPASGVITQLVQHHTRWGQDHSFLPYLNYLTVQTLVLGEFYQICHIGTNSCLFKIGDTIKASVQIATTGVNGYMTDVRHIHMLVGIYTRKNSQGFVSVRIRWQEATV